MLVNIVVPEERFLTFYWKQARKLKAKPLFCVKVLKLYGPLCVLVKMVTLRFCMCSSTLGSRLKACFSFISDLFLIKCIAKISFNQKLDSIKT